MEKQCKNIFGPRVLKAALTSTVLEFLFFVSVSFVVKIKLWQPETWFTTLVHVLTSTLLSYLLPFAFILTTLTFIYFKKIESGDRYFPTRFAMICNLFSIFNLSICCIHTLFGAIVYYIYVRNFLGNDYGNLSMSCKDLTASFCLNELHLYLILYGVWIGFYTYIQTCTGKMSLVFPVVQQSKLLQVKSQLRITLRQALTDAVFPSLCFPAIYYLKGDSVRDHLAEFFKLQIDDAWTSTGIVYFTLIFYSWVIAFMFLLTLYSVKLILQSFLTDHITFPITTVHGVQNGITLSQALNVTKPQAMQYLGFQDLMVLAEKDRQRRQELFSLSQPGGHPHNWNAISDVCLKLLNTFTADLSKSLEPQEIAEGPSMKSSVHHSSTISHNCSAGLRNMSMQDLNFNQPVVMLAQGSTVHETAMCKVKNFFREVVLKKPVLSYFFSELPDAKLQHCISNCQPVIWACQSLALLAAASFQEDKYGVLQKDLPAIITGLLQLKQILDKLQKPGNQKKSQRGENVESKMKHALRSAVRRSMYRITVTFGTYLEDLPLASDVLKEVQNFIKYRD